MDSVVLGGKNSDGNPYSEENEGGGGNYDGDFTLQYADLNDESLASLKQTIDISDGKLNTFTFSFSEKAASVSLYLKKDNEKKQITTVSNTLSKSGLDAEIKVKSSQFKEGWNLYVKAVDVKTKTEHHYKLGNLSFTAKKLQEEKEKEIDISLNTSGKKGIVITKFNPNWLTKDPKTYNHNLARFAMALSSVAYCEGSGSEYGDLQNKNYYDALTKLGFTVEGGEKCLKLARYGSNKPTSKDDHQSIHYYLAHNQYKIDGEENDVVILTLRGTKGNEWYDNFDIDYDNTGKNCDIHDGFKNGADAMQAVLTQYIEKNKLTKNTKILITGHSRGAAVTNLLAAELDKDKNMITDTAGKKSEMKVFAYAYACPNTVATSMIKAEKKSANFDNIYNFVNPDDFVTKVVPSKWGFGRYGTTYVFPAKLDDLAVVGEQNNYIYGRHSDIMYQEFVNNVSDKFFSYWIGEKYDPYNEGMKPVSELVDRITSSVESIKRYYSQKLNDLPENGLVLSDTSLYDVFTDMLAYYMVTEDITNFVKGLGGEYGGLLGQAVASFFFEHNNSIITRSFEYAHTYETYLAMINTVTVEQLKAPKKTLKGIVNCPVDIEIYNRENDLIGQIKDNKVVEGLDSKGEVALEVIGDSKQFVLNSALNYTVKLTGNDTGTMDYISCSEDIDMGEEERIIFQKVPVEKGKTMEVQIEPEQGITSQTLQNEDGTTRTYDSHLSAEELGSITLTTEVEGIGSAYSAGNLTYGDAVTLKATTDEYNQFLGWYDKEGKLLSKETEYPVIATEDTTYVAKFTSNLAPKPTDTQPPVDKENQIVAPTVPVTPNVVIQPSNLLEPNSANKDKIRKKLSKVIVKSTKGKKKSILLKYKKVKGARKYQIQLSTSKKFKKPKRYTTKKLVYRIKKLKKKKVYYIRVRALNGKTKGKWSKARKIKVR